MQGLRILDELRWHDRWSAEIGRHLAVKDSTNDLFIFAPGHDREEIRRLLQEVPDDLYELFDVESAPEEDCDFMADSGQCYRKIQ